MNLTHCIYGLRAVFCGNISSCVICRVSDGDTALLDGDTETCGEAKLCPCDNCVRTREEVGIEAYPCCPFCTNEKNYEETYIHNSHLYFGEFSVCCRVCNRRNEEIVPEEIVVEPRISRTIEWEISWRVWSKIHLLTDDQPNWNRNPITLCNRRVPSEHEADIGDGSQGRGDYCKSCCKIADKKTGRYEWRVWV